MPRQTVPKNSKPVRRERGSLLADDVVAAAIRVIERDGLEQLTMPAIARETNAAVTSIYWHFRSKEDIVVAVAERVTSDLYRTLPPVNANRPWNEEVLDYFSKFRIAMLANQPFLELFATRSRALFAQTTIGTLITDRLEAELEAIVSAGARPGEAVAIYTALSSYVRGFVTLEVFMAREAVSPETRQSMNGRMRSLDKASYPILAAVGEIETAMHYDEEQFLFGLRLLIAGITTELERLRSKRGRGRR
jgi:AcrR family transcriptional regulator